MSVLPQTTHRPVAVELGLLQGQEGLHTFDVEATARVLREAGDAEEEPALAIVLVDGAVVVGDRAQPILRLTCKLPETR